MKRKVAFSWGKLVFKVQNHRPGYHCELCCRGIMADNDEGGYRGYRAVQANPFDDFSLKDLGCNRETDRQFWTIKFTRNTSVILPYLEASLWTRTPCSNVLITNRHQRDTVILTLVWFDECAFFDVICMRLYNHSLCSGPHARWNRDIWVLVFAWLVSQSRQAERQWLPHYEGMLGFWICVCEVHESPTGSHTATATHPLPC